ncbi:MAG: YveK family protein [Clostridia bacterium]
MQMKDMTDETEISLQEIAGILLHCLWLIAGATIMGALIAFLLTKAFITPQYAASASLYVYNTDNRESITQSDITTSQKLVETYIVIMQSDAVLNQVAEESALGYSAKEIKEMFSASAINNTEVFQIVIKNPNPEHAQLLANTFLKVAPSEIIRVVKAGSVETVDEAALPTSPVSPNTVRNTLIGGLLGLFSPPPLWC